MLSQASAACLQDNWRERHPMSYRDRSQHLPPKAYQQLEYEGWDRVSCEDLSLGLGMANRLSL